MSRFANVLGLGAALALGGCSLIWTPTYPDAAPEPDAYVEPPDAWANDVDLDAYEPDAGLDAGPPDAWAPDAWVRPPEVCAVSSGGTEMPEGLDNDGDTLTDCDDPDCYGHRICCNDAVGVQLGGLFAPGTPPSGWTAPGTSLTAGSAGRVVFDFGAAGSAGHVRRSSCAPLAAGARLDVPLARRAGVGEGTLSVVLSPAAAPSPTGFLDELALHFDAATGGFRVTRAGVDQVLPALATCPATRLDDRTYDLDSPSRLVVDIQPGVSDGDSALLVTVEVFGAFGSCMSVRPLVDAPIAVRDLVSTRDERSESCDESPGLYTVFEGEGAAFEVGPSISLQRFECASPAVFAPESRVLGRSSLSTTLPAPSADFASGGIGAPDVDFDGVVWRLSYDGALEDRGSEIFQPLTLRIGQSTSGNFRDWRGVPTDDGAPVTGTGTSSVREPTGLFESTDVVAYSQARGDGNFDLYRAATASDGVWIAPRALAERALADCSFREPALTPGGGGDYWVFFRCDTAMGSTLGLLHAREGMPVTDVDVDILAPVAPEIARRVRAVDVVSRVETIGMATRRHFGIWVLAEGPGGARELHLFVGDAPERSRPTLHPYAGNPVLTASDVREGCTGTCELTSFGVGLEPRPGTDLLRFLFARTRVEASATFYELVPRTQFAPRSLGDGS